IRGLGCAANWPTEPRGGIIPRSPSRRPVPSVDQDVITGPAVEVVLTQPADQDAEAPNVSPATRTDSLPLVPLTMTGAAWKSSPSLGNIVCFSLNHRLTCSMRDWVLVSKVASPL